MTDPSGLAASFADVEAAARRIHGAVRRTPVVRSDRLDDLAGNALFLKCENLQRVGAFKIRGAYNRLALLTPSERARGVVAFSSGNHAQGVALAASLLGIAATIVMPDDAPATKLASTREFGATVITYRRADEDREAIAAALCARSGATLVPPFDDPRIVSGQGTCALELFEEQPELDALVTPLGGGGLLSGCALVANAVAPQTRVYGVEPAEGDDWRRSLARGERVRIPLPRTIADGLQATTPGAVTWPIVKALASGVLTVSDEEIRRAMRVLFDDCRLVVEPSGAAGVAAALAGRLPVRDGRVGIVISGGNVDPQSYCELLQGAPTA